jgi:outer membrane protein OmpA-like peptidoglycan-associated protein
MFLDYIGLTAQAQFVGMPTDDLRGFPEDDVAAQFAFTAGPRFELPIPHPSIAGAETVFYLTAQPGVYAGISGHALDGVAFGATGGGGINVRLNDLFLIGAFARYNWVDERVTGDHGDRDYVQYVTTGIGFTYNPAPPPPVAVIAAARPAPPPAPAPAMRKRIVLRGVNFDFDRSNIRPEARPILDEAIATLRQEGSISIVAEGHTDSKGSDAYNQALSLRRARAVRDYLVAGGVAPGRISVEGYGESRPVASNDTDDGRAQNRRVELRIRGE